MVSNHRQYIPCIIYGLISRETTTHQIEVHSILLASITKYYIIVGHTHTYSLKCPVYMY